MIARVMKAREEIRILGHDMNRTFDTISRQLLVDELKNIIDQDSWRLALSLLERTTLQARIGRALSTPFETNIGTTQGDSLSPVLFVIYLELAMRELRAACPRPSSGVSVPQEIIYADDMDTISKSLDLIAQTEATAPAILGRWDLLVNSDKTEHTTLKRGEETTNEHETWRNTKKLGTLLGETQEMHRRKQLAAAAFQSMKRIWSRKHHNKISVVLRLHLYNAYVLPVLTYNACTWALSQTEQEELDAFHRRQLRKVIGIKYPRIISNESLYMRCNTQALSHTIREARWRMLGHVLRMDDQITAKHAMKHYFDSTSSKDHGKPRTTLQSVLDHE
jgi:hypothetical protein